ncbi:hypothetical protein [Polaromonas sp.]|uniref:hypothetical protein n=1 Tax=Polaromonas sp. TaxID=1869339 RepID=UPI00286A6AD7|nr:hypothetical protein [Polaromonas sp.]
MTAPPAMDSLTPQERLAISRKAIVRHMGRHDQDDRDERAERVVDHRYGDFDAAERSRQDPNGSWGMVRHATQAWWRHHPAGVAFDLAKPVLGRYAREQPFKLLGMAAGIGAAAVVLRPWRLISLGGLLLATLKSSQLSSLVLSMLSAPRGDGAGQRKGP